MCTPGELATVWTLLDTPGDDNTNLNGEWAVARSGGAVGQPSKRPPSTTTSSPVM